MDIIQQTLKHSVWECKYHVVWIPKYRKKTLYSELRKYFGEIFHELVKQKDWGISPVCWKCRAPYRYWECMMQNREILYNLNSQ
jgi:putative transposase